MSQLITNYFGEVNHDFPKGYCFSNESLKNLFKRFDLNGKSTLTVGSSGDQAIASAERGSNDITVVDVCPLAEYIYYYKITAKQYLTPIELDLLFEFDYLDYMIYEKFKEFLPEKIRKFWDYVYNHYGIGNSIDINEIFIEPIHRSKIDKRVHYFSTENLKIANISPNFITSDIRDFSIEKKYDFIYFSNIFAYIGLANSIECIFSKYESLLNKNGTMVLQYLLNPLYRHYIVNCKNLINDLGLNSKNFDFIEFTDMGKGFPNKHSALVYKKKI